MNEVKKIGPFEVKALTIPEGLKILERMNSRKEGEPEFNFQEELMYAAVSKDGVSVREAGLFVELLPHVGEIYAALSELNPFRNSTDNGLGENGVSGGDSPENAGVQAESGNAAVGTDDVGSTLVGVGYPEV